MAALMASWSEPRRPSCLSQTGRLLALLERGGWWTTAELLHEVPSVIHSRMAELRKYGWNVEHRTTGAGARGSEYRLVLDDAALHGGSVPLIDGAASSSATAAAAQAEPDPPGSPPGVDGAGQSVVAFDPNQLFLPVAS